MTLEAIAEEFADVDDETRLELLLDYAVRLPPLPPAYHALRDAGVNMIHECQSPVFMTVEVTGGTVHLYADVPREAPTPRSFVSILVRAFDGQPAHHVLEAPDDLLYRLGLTHLLGMQRIHGLSAIYRHTLSEVARQL